MTKYSLNIEIEFYAKPQKAIKNLFKGIMHKLFDIIHNVLSPARGGKCSDGGIVPNTAFIFMVFVAT